MQISGAGQNVVRDSGCLKSVRKGIVLAGKMVAGGAAGVLIDGVGMPVVWTKEMGRSIIRDLRTLVTGKDVQVSLANLVLDAVALPIGFASFAVLGTIGGLVVGAAVNDEDGLEEGIDVCVDLVKAQNEKLKEIYDDGPFFSGGGPV